jgi:hypothetical protein
MDEKEISHAGYKKVKGNVGRTINTLYIMSHFSVPQKKW